MDPSHLPKKQIGWVPCGITYEGILVPGSTGDPANMAAQGGCSLRGRRKKGEGEGGGRKGKGKGASPSPPLPNPPPLFPFLPIPYPLPLSTPATQARRVNLPSITGSV